ncbi:Lactonase, 7-bladed beta-propeller-domain-containing protein [Cadophora sp. MPI-SDFR-AT-0126]|nr:Lactonase, 7-bladed beta-propeller-domain-containing protein [Leotiomycetes sp. MPI-SDFR-AT-0126]
MSSLPKVMLKSAILATAASATNLFVACTNGNLTTLSLTGSGNTSNLAISSWTNQCASNPAALNLDYQNRILYCMDRASSSSVNGSMNSFDIDTNGNLTRLARIPVPASGVWAGFFGAEGGNQGLATVHYNRSAYSIIGISDDGQLNGPLQTVFPTLAAPGPIPLRQDRSYLHEVQTDPTGKFLAMNDLGGDMVRVFTYDIETLAPVTEVSQLLTEPGVGPRHGVFWTAPSGKLYYIFAGELSQNVYSYEITYTDVGMSWTKVFEIPALGVGNERPAQQAPTSELRLTPDNRFIIVSNRDVSFAAQDGPTDTLSTFCIKEDGTLELIQLAPSGGWSPRQFSLNKKGDLLAVGHQNNFTVIVWQRDLKSGKIVGEGTSITLSTAVVVTIWDE